LRNIKADPPNEEGSFCFMNNKKVIVYVDGFNFYFGLKSKKWKSFYWLDFVTFFKKFLKSYQELVEVVYFSATPLDPGKHDRQDKLFQANKLNPIFRLQLGKYLKKNIYCPYCQNTIHTFEEKETDVRIATKMISDVLENRCDISILVSADSDLVPPIEFIRQIKPEHKIFIYFPPGRHSINLKSLSDGTKDLGSAFQIFNQCLLPESVQLPSGYVIERPKEWI
jgi:uncharacterized LabA/DUF88 family protein